MGGGYDVARKPKGLRTRIERAILALGGIIPAVDFDKSLAWSAFGYERPSSLKYEMRPGDMRWGGLVS